MRFSNSGFPHSHCYMFPILVAISQRYSRNSFYFPGVSTKKVIIEFFSAKNYLPVFIYFAGVDTRK